MKQKLWNKHNNFRDNVSETRVIVKMVATPLVAVHVNKALKNGNMCAKMIPNEDTVE